MVNIIDLNYSQLCLLQPLDPHFHDWYFKIFFSVPSVYIRGLLGLGKEVFSIKSLWSSGWKLNTKFLQIPVICLHILTPLTIISFSLLLWRIWHHGSSNGLMSLYHTESHKITAFYEICTIQTVTITVGQEWSHSSLIVQWHFHSSQWHLLSSLQVDDGAKTSNSQGNTCEAHVMRAQLFSTVMKPSFI